MAEMLRKYSSFKDIEKLLDKNRKTLISEIQRSSAAVSEDLKVIVGFKDHKDDLVSMTVSIPLKQPERQHLRSTASVFCDYGDTATSQVMPLRSDPVSLRNLPRSDDSDNWR